MPQISDGLFFLMVHTVVLDCCILLVFGLCFGLKYLEGGGLTGQSRFTFVVFEYIASVSLISVCRAQLHTIVISPCWARRVGGEHWQCKITGFEEAIHSFSLNFT